MNLQRYRNLSGKSNVYAFEVLTDAVIVQFNDKTVYTYQLQKVGTSNLMEMKRLALAGVGLNSLINRTPAIRKGHSGKSIF